MGVESSQFEHTFTTDSFSEFQPIWVALFDKFEPKTILEIRSFEGWSACFTIEEATKHGDVELHCMDSFKLAHRSTRCRTALLLGPKWLN